MPLTNTEIQNIKPGGKPKKIYDSEGLYLEVSPKGGRWWRLKYRFNKKEKRISLGVYPSISLKEARERRNEARKLLAQQIDPSEHRKTTKGIIQEQADNSFELIAREWFAKKSPAWSKGHATRMIGGLERDIFLWLG